MIIMGPFFIISNYVKLIQSMPWLCKSFKNIDKSCKFCIKSEKIALKWSDIFWKIMQYMRNYARCIKPRGQHNARSQFKKCSLKKHCFSFENGSFHLNTCLDVTRCDSAKSPFYLKNLVKTITPIYTFVDEVICNGILQACELDTLMSWS